jgi:hypothetical protein
MTLSTVSNSRLIGRSSTSALFQRLALALFGNAFAFFERYDRIGIMWRVTRQGFTLQDTPCVFDRIEGLPDLAMYSL